MYRYVGSLKIFHTNDDIFLQCDIQDIFFPKFSELYILISAMHNADAKMFNYTHYLLLNVEIESFSDHPVVLRKRNWSLVYCIKAIISEAPKLKYTFDIQTLNFHNSLNILQHSRYFLIIMNFQSAFALRMGIPVTNKHQLDASYFILLSIY